MEGRLMFNPGQELMQGFCQETMQPLTQRRNVDQMPNLSTITGCLSVSVLWLFFLSPQYFEPFTSDAAASNILYLKVTFFFSVKG